MPTERAVDPLLGFADALPAASADASSALIQAPTRTPWAADAIRIIEMSVALPAAKTPGTEVAPVGSTAITDPSSTPFISNGAGSMPSGPR